MTTETDSQKTASQKTKQPRFGLAAILFIWFMMLSLSPIGVIGIIEYHEGRKSIINSRYEQLSITSLLLSQQINDYFNSIVTSLYVKAEVADDLLKELSDGFQASNQPLADYISSQEYRETLNNASADLVDYLRYYDYSDVILGDIDGNILYTVNTYSDLGMNLFSGELSSTAFADGVQQAFASKEPNYVDISDYPPLKGQKVSFFILPITNDWGEATGFLAIQILAYNVQSIFETDEELGSTLKSYLIGRDFYIRYGTGIDSSQSMTFKSENNLTHEWLEHLKDGAYIEIDHFDDELMDIEHLTSLTNNDHDLHESEGKHSEKMTTRTHIQEYHNVFGQPVLATYRPINVAGTEMALISEVNRYDAFSSVNKFRDRLLFISVFTALIVLFIALLITRRLTMPIRAMNEQVNRVATGDYSQSRILKGYREIRELSHSFSEMTDKLRRLITENKRKSWRQEGLAGLHKCMRGEQELPELCKNIISYLARYLNMQTGAMYVMNNEQHLELMGTFAWSSRKGNVNKFKLGEGMVGQAALERQTLELTHLPEDYMVIQSGLGQVPPYAVIVVPLVYEGDVKGVIELALIETPTDEQKNFLKVSLETIAIGLNSAQYRDRAYQLLDQTTKQSEALKEQQGQLELVNGELEKRAEILEESQEEMKAQSEELQKSNAEMEEKTELLQQQKEEIELKNLDIELSKKTLEEKAVELEQASKYKSEFLANMSHELRTPLNSLLLLSQMLASNDDGNLSEDEVESATVIYNSGNSLLSLINDILDLSKVEAGKMTVNLEDVDLEELCTGVESLFKPLADEKGIDFSINIEAGTTRTLLSDGQRLTQILKNFLSNAFKFTEQGGVSIAVSNTTRKNRFGDCSYIGFAVKDSGIGIPKDRQQAIFEAFQQVDGSTSRQYGGTGLGLAISREFAELLGGFIELHSTLGEGTTFTLYLPDNAVCSLSQNHVEADGHCHEKSPGYHADRNTRSKVNNKPVSKASVVTPKVPTPDPAPASTLAIHEKTLLIIEDDLQFSDTVNRLSKASGYHCLVAETGQEGLQLAREQHPEAIILDLGLPDISGKEVLAKLKEHPDTKDIPVHIISGMDPEHSKIKSAVGYLMKPVSMADLSTVFNTLDLVPTLKTKNALLLDTDKENRTHLAELLQQKGIATEEVETAAEAEIALSEGDWQCLIMDTALPDSSGLAFLERLREEMPGQMPFVVIHTDRQLSREEYQQYRQFTQALVIKGEHALERVTDEVSLFIHSLRKDNPEPEADMPVITEKTLNGHKVLLVDDDLRNTFALSKGLQSAGLEVVIADNGQNALDKLEEEDGIEIILMDIMMPVMDGYEAMTRIRQIERFGQLPIIALTAKAMSDDKVKCIDAGANDYMTKPVDLEKLLEMMKVWLFK